MVRRQPTDTAGSGVCDPRSGEQARWLSSPRIGQRDLCLHGRQAPVGVPLVNAGEFGRVLVVAVDVRRHRQPRPKGVVAVEVRADREVGPLGSFHLAAALLAERPLDFGEQLGEFEQTRHVVVGKYAHTPELRPAGESSSPKLKPDRATSLPSSREGVEAGVWCAPRETPTHHLFATVAVDSVASAGATVLPAPRPATGMRVVVVGGGIVGLSSAYALATRGADVTVCEKGRLGDGSTSRALGGIRAQFSTAVNVDLSLASLPVWESFEERFGVDIAFRQTGYLMLARTEETAAGLEQQVEMQREHGAGTELLTPEEAAKHCAGVDPDAITAATFNARDGFADPYLALQGFADGAREAGVDIRTNTAVTDVQFDDGRAVGVAVEGDGAPPDGSIHADALVNAAGPWAGRVAELAGVDVPVEPQRRQAVVVDPERPVPESDPLTIDLETGSHFRPERDGAAVVGGYFADQPETPSPDAYSDTHDLPWAAEAVERAGIYCDYFGDETRLKRGWAGLYAVTPDHHPIIEKSRPGFVQAIGFSGHGFQHAPATGEVVAELLLDGEASTVDIDALGSDRFAGRDLLRERNVA